MRTAATLLACSTLAVLALPLSGQDRPNLSGTWQFDSSKSELHSVKVADVTWVIHEDDSSIQITESEGRSNRKIELECTIDGKECKISGDKATTVDTTSIVPQSSQDDVLVFRKQA